MLLRRVIEHVKTQNWTAVALDFFIVVVGIQKVMQMQLSLAREIDAIIEAERAK
ncbi:MAG TPA: hypothetical protein VMQ83_12835 [Gammaproteobacteria bacterium]|nr:hypothetical protein [Gammaproteobacteria bacterium]